MKRGNWLLKLFGFTILAFVFYKPAPSYFVDDTPRFEASMPSVQAPRLMPISIPEDRSDTHKKPQPIEPDPSIELNLPLS
jgi:hypothetical protein